MPRKVEGSSKRKFIKKEKIHQAQKGASPLRQERSLESASKWPKIIKLRNTRRAKGPQKFIQSRDERPKKKKKRKKKRKKRKKKEKEKKPARLKTQKGGLGKS